MSSPEPFPASNAAEHAGFNEVVSPEVAEHIASLVAEAHEKKEYRPVGVAIIEDPEGRLLFIQSAKNHDDWWFPQGGIEPGEDAAAAVLRESWEEVGIQADELTFKGFLGSKDLDAEAGRLDKRGFTKGKRYLFFHLGYSGAGPLALQESEVADFSWTPADQVVNRLSTTRLEKKQMFIACSV
jgi:8-oxo-dGTP pyrophosphatase MutT (NUDIX family)